MFNGWVLFTIAALGVCVGIYRIVIWILERPRRRFFRNMRGKP